MKIIDSKSHASRSLLIYPLLCCGIVFNYGCAADKAAKTSQYLTNANDAQEIGDYSLALESYKAAALANPAVLKFCEGKAPKKVIVVPGRLVNLVI